MHNSGQVIAYAHYILLTGTEVCQVSLEQLVTESQGAVVIAVVQVVHQTIQAMVILRRQVCSGGDLLDPDDAFGLLEERVCCIQAVAQPFLLLKLLR